MKLQLLCQQLLSVSILSVASVTAIVVVSMEVAVVVEMLSISNIVSSVGVRSISAPPAEVDVCSVDVSSCLSVEVGASDSIIVEVSMLGKVVSSVGIMRDSGGNVVVSDAVVVIEASGTV